MVNRGDAPLALLQPSNVSPQKSITQLQPACAQPVCFAVAEIS
jgi:hypothetical protein